MSFNLNTLARFPYESEFQILNKKIHYQEVIDTLEYYFTDERKLKMRKVASMRSFEFVPVMEKFFDHGNISAVCRSAESMGFQNVYAIDNDVVKHSHRISKGSDKWLDVPAFSSSTECIQNLKSKGYKVLATHMSENAKYIQDFDFSQPTAVLFGCEGYGVSQEALNLCDENMLIPMCGLTQSYNVSVAAAITMYHVQQERIRKLGSNSELSEEQKSILYAAFLMRGMPDAIANSLKRVFKID